MTMYGFGYGGSMMLGMGLGGILAVLFCILIVAALVKFVFFSGRP